MDNIEKLEKLEEEMYLINSEVVSLRWIALKKVPTEFEIRMLNGRIGSWIKLVREIKLEVKK